MISYFTLREHGIYYNINLINIKIHSPIDYYYHSTEQLVLDLQSDDKILNPAKLRIAGKGTEMVHCITS